MKRNNLYDFLFILLIYLAISSFPFGLIFPDNLTLITILQIAVQILGNIFIVLYSKKKSKLNLEFGKFNIVNCLILIPTLLICFSNYFCLPFANNVTFSIQKINYLSLILAMLVALNEELIFRFIFMNNLETTPFYKVIFSALIFGVCHITRFLDTLNPFDLLTIGYATALGLLLAFSYISTNSIIPGIVIHFLFNTINGNIFENCVNYSSLNQLTYVLVNVGVGTVVATYVLLIVILRRKQMRR